MDDKTPALPGQAAHDDAASQAANPLAPGAPVRQAGASEFPPDRSHEADADAEESGGSSSATGEQQQAQPTADEPTVGETLNGGPSQQPRDGTRIGKPSSQGLAGAQGSGGGAERGPNQLV